MIHVDLLGRMLYWENGLFIKKITQMQDNAGATCDSGLGMSSFIYFFGGERYVSLLILGPFILKVLFENHLSLSTQPSNKLAKMKSRKNDNTFSNHKIVVI